MELSLTMIVLIGVLLLVAVGVIVFRVKMVGPPVPDALRAGRPLPDFSAIDEHGEPVRSADLRGAPAVILFVRGNWCPFCNKQVRNLTDYYKEIGNLGARLVLLTPKPLETTRRVAEFFEVDFDFWLDETLAVGRELGLVNPSGVPRDYRKEYGEDTIWPASLVVDAGGTIRYSKLSKYIFDRPDPQVLVNALKKAL